MADIPQWHLAGDWFDVCSCSMPCPCEFAQAPTGNHCQGVLAYHVREGSYGDVSLDGLNVVALGEFEGNVWDGAKVALGMYVDDRADEAQQQALLAIFGGEAGGWPAQFAETVGEMRGMERVPITMEVSGDLSRFSVEVPGRVNALAEALTGPTTPPGARVQRSTTRVRGGARSGRDLGRRHDGPRRRTCLRLPVAGTAGPASTSRSTGAVRTSEGRRTRGGESSAGADRCARRRVRRVVVVVSAWLVAGSVLAWVVTAGQASDMAGMAGGLAEIGTASPMTLTGATFLVMWVGMTTAMMFPTAVPMVAAHRMVTRRRGEGAASTVAFVLGYLTAWTVAVSCPWLPCSGSGTCRRRRGRDGGCPPWPAWPSRRPAPTSSPAGSRSVFAPVEAPWPSS